MNAMRGRLARGALGLKAITLGGNFGVGRLLRLEVGTATGTGVGVTFAAVRAEVLDAEATGAPPLLLAAAFMAAFLAAFSAFLAAFLAAPAELGSPFCRKKTKNISVCVRK